jgi:hypothetical protein
MNVIVGMSSYRNPRVFLVKIGRREAGLPKECNLGMKVRS